MKPVPKKRKRVELLDGIVLRTKFSKEQTASYNKWIAPRRYFERLPYIMAKGGRKVPNNGQGIF